MNDWTEEAAKEICRDIGDNSGDAMTGIMAAIRRHAPPLRAWCERPTCAGLWMHAIDSRCGVMEIKPADLEWAAGNPGRWYGPVPSPPVQEKRE